MFTFLNPIFLFAVSAAAVPLVLHLMQRKRTVRLPFSTIRFLQMAEKRSSNRIRMENFLLWLIRTLIMLFLAMAFAMPMLRTKAIGKFFSNAERDIAIVLDASYSMDYNTGKDTGWNKAVKTALAIVDGLDDGDRVCVFLANDNVKPVVEQLTQDKEFVAAQLKALKVETTTSQLYPAVIAANDALKKENKRREREVHIITDGQALPWTGFVRTENNRAVRSKENNDSGSDSAISANLQQSSGYNLWQPEKIDKKTAFFVTLVGVPEPENVSPLDVEIQPELIMADTPSKLKVKLGLNGSAQSSLVTISIDGKELDRHASITGGDDTGDITFTIPPLKAGIHSGKIETPIDNLIIDNSFYFLIRVKESLPSLCVGSRDDTFYLMKALNASLTSKSTMAIKRIESNKLGEERISKYSCIFLCNALPLSGQSILNIEQFVKSGGLLVIFPGNRAAIEDYKAWKCLPGSLSKIKEVSMNDRKRILRWSAPRHPLLRTLKLAPGSAPVITIRRHLTWKTPVKNGTPLILSGEEDLFLLEREFGKGRVLLFSLSADRSWGSFPLSQFFLPIAHQMVQYGSGIIGEAPYLWTKRSLSLTEYLPVAEREIVLLDPVKNNISVRSSMVNNKTILLAEDMMIPGIYTISQTDNREEEPALAININRMESNLTPVKKEEIPGIFGIKNLNIASGKEELLRLIKEHRIGQTLGEQLLWLTLILAAVEVFYANRKSKTSSSLSEILGIEASGRVKK